MAVPNLSVVKDAVNWPQVQTASFVAGCGMNVPERVVDNNHFASYLETTDEWIRERTGIAERRWSAPEVCASELAEPAAREAIAHAGLTIADIDAMIVATVTPDYSFPSTACLLQRRLGSVCGLAFDLNAVCSGFVYALVTADALIASGQCRNALVVGVDIYSYIINPKDRGTCILFGDGAGAVVLSAAAPAGNPGGASRWASGSAGALRGIYASELGADGNGANLLYVPNGTASRPTPESYAAGEHFLRMDGREVFKVAVRRLCDISEKVLARAGIAVGQVDYFITHQANKRIVLSMAKHLGVDESKVLVNIHKYGNTSAASIPMLLAESAAEGKIKHGDLLLVTAFGGGFTWGGVLLRW